MSAKKKLNVHMVTMHPVSEGADTFVLKEITSMTQFAMKVSVRMAMPSTEKLVHANSLTQM